MLEQLNSWDTQLFLFLNSKHNAFLDPVMYWASHKWFWLPFYFLLALWLFRNYALKAFPVFLCIALLITISDQTSSRLIKQHVKRLRPCHNEAIAAQVHLSEAGCGGSYGFVSSHAANGFAFAVFFSLFAYRKKRFIAWIPLPFALLVSYSRIYVGVHYPGDVLCGALLGSILGLIFFRLYLRFFSVN